MFDMSQMLVLTSEAHPSVNDQFFSPEEKAEGAKLCPCCPPLRAVLVQPGGYLFICLFVV